MVKAIEEARQPIANVDNGAKVSSEASDPGFGELHK